MSKLFKDTHVYIPCPACGKTQRTKLKWAGKHKSLKCSDCKQKVDLRAEPARGFITKTALALATFERTLDTLHRQAKKAAKAGKPTKQDRQAKKAVRKAGKKRKAKK